MIKQNSVISKQRLSRSLIPAATFMAIAATSLSAHATLGGDSASVTADQSALHATMTTSSHTNYTDYALTLPNGVTAHELVNAAGKVFEVTWSGKGHRPDMDQLLGSYAANFGGQNATGGSSTRRHARHTFADLVIDSTARNGYFSGLAYIPSLLPGGLTGPVIESAGGAK